MDRFSPLSEIFGSFSTCTTVPSAPVLANVSLRNIRDREMRTFQIQSPLSVTVELQWPFLPLDSVQVQAVRADCELAGTEQRGVHAPACLVGGTPALNCSVREELEVSLETP